MKKISFVLLAGLLYFSFLSFVLAYSGNFFSTPGRHPSVYRRNSSSAEQVKTLNALSALSNGKKLSPNKKTARTNSTSASRSRTQNNNTSTNNNQPQDNNNNITANVQINGGGRGCSWLLNLGPFRM
ncbi:MAG: hypothetical protein NC920_02565 [Candidatus Omnitrophica bacterium]|nr:hypothetical protein [Candidatus Omnitrophota bacterium]MCM8798961.1 hypothetical protein [Candidatus Omnitrophota bacterium]